MLRKIYKELVRIRKELHAIRSNMESFSEKQDVTFDLDLLDKEILLGQTSINDARKMLALQPIEGGDSLITRV